MAKKIRRRIKQFFCLHHWVLQEKSYKDKYYTTYFFQCKKCGKWKWEIGNNAKEVEK